MGVTADEALGAVAGFYPWHLSIFFLVAASTFIPTCYQSFNFIFIGYEPPHHCRIPDNSTLNNSVPYTVELGRVVWAKCEMYADDNSTVPCQDGWTYDADGYSTIVTEWDLVCDKNYMTDMSQMLFQVVYLFATMPVSYLTDRLGRKPVFIICSNLAGLTGILVSVSSNLAMLMVVRCLGAVFVGGALIAGFTLVLEMFDSEKRTFAGVALEISWLVVFVPMALFAWAIPNWRHLQATLSAVSLFSIAYIWIMPESLPWLVATGRLDKADRVISFIARWNRVKVKDTIKVTRPGEEAEPLKGTDAINMTQTTEEREPQQNSEAHNADATEVQRDPEDTTEEQRELTFTETIHYFKDRLLLKHTLITMALWFANSAIYFALHLVSPTLPGDRFVNFFLLSVVEIPAYYVTYVVIKRFGRRIPLSAFHLVAGLFLGVMVFLPPETASGRRIEWLSVIFMIIAKFAISATFAILILFGEELVPTVVRGTCTGLGNTAGRLGNILAPLAAYGAKTSVKWLPSVVCGVLSIAVGLLTLALPETNHKPLPQNVADLRKLYDKPSLTGASKARTAATRDQQQQRTDPLYKT